METSHLLCLGKSNIQNKLLSIWLQQLLGSEPLVPALQNAHFKWTLFKELVEFTEIISGMSLIFRRDTYIYICVYALGLSLSFVSPCCFTQINTKFKLNIYHLCSPHITVPLYHLCSQNWMQLALLLMLFYVSDWPPSTLHSWQGSQLLFLTTSPWILLLSTTVETGCEKHLVVSQ